MQQPSHSPPPKSPQRTPSTKRDNKPQRSTPRGVDKKSSIYYGRKAPNSTNKVDHSKHLSQNSKGAGKKSALTGKKTPAISKTKADNKAILADWKGVDKQLAETILDEVVESDSLVITWDDIVGLELPKRTLQEIVILPALRPELFTGLRSPCRGLLLFGPPGNGKTMLIGDGEKLVRAMFTLARKMQPSVIFLDEVDALLSHRGDSENDAMRRLKNEFLQSFDGMHTTEGERILVMAAINRPQELDDAALRRFGKRIYIPLPEQQARKSVLAKLIVKHNHSITEEHLQTLAIMTEGYSASDLKALASDASLGPIRELDLATLKSVPADMVRPITFQDFKLSLHQSRTSVSMELIRGLEEWNANYGVSA